MAEEVQRKQLVILPWSEGAIEVAILMIWFRDRWISPTLEAFMDLTKRILKQVGGDELVARSVLRNCHAGKLSLFKPRRRKLQF